MKLTVTSLHLGLGAGLLAVGLLALPLTPRAQSGDQVRLLTLGGSVTEIVVALGAENQLVARDSTSTYPPSVMDLPDVGYVRALSPEGVLSVAPELILSERGAGPAETIAVLEAAGVEFVTMPDDPTPQGVLNKIDAVAMALRLPDAGAALRQDVAAGLAAATARATAVTDRQRVLFVLSLQSGRVMAGGEGSSAEGIIELAGGVNAATGFDGYKQMTDEAVIAAAPDLILMMDREGDLAISTEDVQAHPALGLTPAGQNGNVLRMNGVLLLGFGPRTPAAATALHAALYGTGG
ncbi:ABC transporter substrate-binding protein [Seohaeicola saemankumensis]|uniref:heme/hemin ABC transporter substrate-binding protein n=1 Tax=Seohaeicola saemankumensis TaxID=481181 RepID=UPI001E358866|nr:ABC transporter substrate-binding protein [Seohaeicola saemankumensis]MCD1627586.1 ABC transporter substrate-binding protein [Seohaeicola saemankumensis]